MIKPDFIKNIISPHSSAGRFLSLDIGSSSLKIGLVSGEEDNRCVILDYAISDIPKGSGDVIRAAKTFVSEFLNNRKISEKRLVVSFYDREKVYIKLITLPKMPEQELPQAVRWEIGTDAQVDLKDVYLDWKVVGSVSDEEGADMNEIVVACIKKSSVREITSMAEALSLSLRDIRINPFNIANLLSRYDDLRNRCAVALDVGAWNTSFIICYGGALYFLRSIPFGSQNITSAMLNRLVYENRTIELSLEEAERIKRIYGIPDDPNAVIENKIKASQILALIRPALERLVSDIKKSVDYYSSNFRQCAPEKIFLAGGGANLKGIASYLESELDIEVERLRINDFCSGQTYDVSKCEEDASSLMGLIGAGLYVKNSISLLPEEYKRRGIDRIKMALLRLAAITAVTLFSIYAAFTFLRIADYSQRVRHAEAHLSVIQGIMDIKNNIEDMQWLLGYVKGNRIPAHWILKEVSNRISPNIVLQSLKLHYNRNVLILNGFVLDNGNCSPELTALIKALDSTKLFSECNIRFSGFAEYEGNRATKFEIWCDLI